MRSAAARLEEPAPRAWPKSIVADASCLVDQKTGVGHYIVNSLTALMGLLPGTEFHIFLGRRWARALPDEAPLRHGAARARLIGMARRSGLAQALWRSYSRRRFVPYLRATAPDLIYAPNYLPPAPCEPVVPVVYDLSHVRMPEAHPSYRVARLSRLDRLLERAPAIVTISHFSKQEIIDVYGVPGDKLVVASPGVAPAFRSPPVDQRLAVLHRHGLEDRRYFLAIGNLEPRKNLRALVEAYARLPEALRDRYALALGGGAGWGDAGLLGRLPERLRRAGQLRLLGYVASRDLPALYAGAAAFCFPSLYEGFGMPVVEAMACGANVIASNAGAVAEAAGRAALLIDPRDTEAWTEGLRRLVEDAALAGRLRAEGPAQAARFTWDECGERILEAFDRAAPGAVPPHATRVIGLAGPPGQGLRR